MLRHLLIIRYYIIEQAFINFEFITALLKRNSINILVLNWSRLIGLCLLYTSFEITSNRPDCFSVIGLAREIAATFDKELKLHTPVVKAGHGNCESMLDVKIERCV